MSGAIKSPQPAAKPAAPRGAAKAASGRVVIAEYEFGLRCTDEIPVPVETRAVRDAEKIERAPSHLLSARSEEHTS